MKALFFIILPLLFAAGAQARGDIYQFNTPTQEASYQRLLEELRCLVCQNQNLADSNAELAQDLRQKTYEMITAGNSEEEIIAYMVNRYGDFVLYRPPVRGSTLLLWVGPFIILIVGVAILITIVRRKMADNVDAKAVEHAAWLLRQKDGNE